MVKVEVGKPTKVLLPKYCITQNSHGISSFSPLTLEWKIDLLFVCISSITETKKSNPVRWFKI